MWSFLELDVSWRQTVQHGFYFRVFEILLANGNLCATCCNISQLLSNILPFSTLLLWWSNISKVAQTRLVGAAWLIWGLKVEVFPNGCEARVWDTFFLLLFCTKYHICQKRLPELDSFPGLDWIHDLCYEARAEHNNQFDLLLLVSLKWWK